MEEYVGQVWDRFITRAAEKRSDAVAVTLEEMSQTLAVFFRALGGDPGLSILASQSTPHGARRSWLQHIAGSGERIALSWRDHESIRLPGKIDVFPSRQLNRDLYFWLTALLTISAVPGESWILQNQNATLAIFERFPGLRSRYFRMVKALFKLRPNPKTLKKDESEQELALREALSDPGSVHELPFARNPFHPVLLWTHPAPPTIANGTRSSRNGNIADELRAKSKAEKNLKKYSAQSVEDPDEKNGFLLMFRAESIFSWGEYTKVSRSQDDEDDIEAARKTADDMDHLSISDDNDTTAASVKFDLDMSPSAEEFVKLSPGHLLPEWNWKKRVLLPDYCSLQEVITPDVAPIELPNSLKRTSKKLCRQFQSLTPSRYWLNGEQDGEDIDLNSWVRLCTDVHAGFPTTDRGLFRKIVNRQRDLACLVLADLSLSTDAYVSNNSRAIDVIQNTLLLFSEALETTGDEFALYGFSSLKRNSIHFHHLKGFDEAYGGIIRGRIAAIKPGFYTRMGAAIRYATELLAKQNKSQRILFLISDGKPNDVDMYEGRYGIEDTRMALIEARQLGLRPFCITIDVEANEYLPHLMGNGNYIVIKNPEELPEKLAVLYAQLTR